MTTLNDALGRATGILYQIHWIPEDWPLSQKDFLKSYVVARSIDEATARLTDNPFDIKRVIVLGHVIEQPK